MEGINAAFYYVVDKIIELQGYFLVTARSFAGIVFAIALCLAAINYAMTGEGLKSNIIKIFKALVFVLLIIVLYPKVIGWICKWTQESAKNSMGKVEAQFTTKKEKIIEHTRTQRTRHGTVKSTYAETILTTEYEDAGKYFTALFVDNTTNFKTGWPVEKIETIAYTTIAPAAALELIVLVAGECFNYAAGPREGEASRGIFESIAAFFKGLLMAVAVIITGVLAVIEYLIAFLEFMLVTSVGVLLLPFMIWDPAKFLSEKLIGAIIGFTLKLLFCNICIYLLLYGFMTLSSSFATKPFTGEADEFVMVIFVSFFYFIICSKGPALATSLLTGSPSLSGSQAIGAVGGAIGGVAAGLGIAKAAGGAVAGGAAKAAFGGGGALAQAGAAAKAAGDLGGGLKEKAGAFMSSIGSSAKEAGLSKGSNMARSLLGRGGGGGTGGGGGGASGGPGGLNRHSQLDSFASGKNADGTRRSFAEQIKERKEAGTNRGADYMAKQEEKRNKKTAAKDEGKKA